MSDLFSGERRGRRFPSIIDHVFGITWRLHRASPLFRFHLHELSRYKEELSQAMSSAQMARALAGKAPITGKKPPREGSNKAANIRLERDEPSDTNASAMVISMRQMEGLPQEGNSVLIKVVQQDAQGALLDVCSIIMVAHRPAFDEKYQDSFSYFPLLLSRGRLPVVQAALEWMSCRFDCTVSRFALPPYHLTSIAGQWASNEFKSEELYIDVLRDGHNLEMVLENTEKTPHQVEFSYDLPTAIQGLRTITLGLLSTNVSELSDAIVFAEGDLDIEQKGHQILDAVSSHFMAHFKINLSSSRLSRVTCYVGMLAADGKIKISSRPHLFLMLKRVAAIVSKPGMGNS